MMIERYAKIQRGVVQFVGGFNDMKVGDVVSIFEPDGTPVNNISYLVLSEPEPFINENGEETLRVQLEDVNKLSEDENEDL